MDGKVHEFRVAERMVGALYGDERDDVVFGERFGVFDRHGRVGRTVEDHHIVGAIEVLILPHIARGEVVEQLPVDLHLALHADEDILALLDFLPIVIRDVRAHEVVHADAGAAQRNLFERVADLRDVFQREVAAEADGVDEDVLRLQDVFRVVHDERQVLHALGKHELLARVLPVARPVERNHGVRLVLRRLLLRAFLDVRAILAAAVAVRADDDTRVRPRITVREQLAADAVAVRVDVEMFFHENSFQHKRQAPHEVCLFRFNCPAPFLLPR